MIKNSDIYNMDNRIYNTRDQNENQNSGQKKKTNRKTNRKINQLLRKQGELKDNIEELEDDVNKLKLENNKLKRENNELKRENDRLSKNNDMLVLQNHKLLQIAPSFTHPSQNEQISNDKQNQLQNLRCFGIFYPYFTSNINNQFKQQKHPLSLNSSTFIPKNENQTHNSYNQKKNVNNHIDVSSSKLSFEDKSDIKVLNQLNNLGSDKSSKNFNTFQQTTDGVKNCFQNVVIKNMKKTTDDNRFHFDKEINSWLNIESTWTELEKMKNVIPGKQRSFSEKLKDMKSNPKHTTNKVPSMIAEYEKF